MKAFKTALVIFFGLIITVSLIAICNITSFARDSADNTDIDNIATARSGKCGNNLTWSLDDEGLLTISGTGDMYDYLFSSSPFEYLNIKNVIIEDGVTSIGNCVFTQNDSIEYVSVSDSVTEIGKNAFYKCVSLKEINIPDGVSVIYEQTFYCCKMLKSIYIGKSVQKVCYGAFIDCKELSAVYISDVAAWCSIEFQNEECNPLYHAKKLYLNDDLITDLIIPEGVSVINQYAFINCTSITDVHIPKSLIKSDWKSFEGCTNISNVNITDLAAWCNIDFYLTTSNPMRSASKLYLNGELLRDISIPNEINVLNEYTFYNCTSLENVTFHEDIVKIGNYSFYNCSNLKSINIPNKVTSIGYHAFENCINATQISIPDSVECIYPLAFNNTGVFNDESNWEDSVLYIDHHLIAAKPEIYPSCDIKSTTLTIAGNAFYDCIYLYRINIPSSVKYIGESAFSNCPLSEVIIPEGVIGIYSAAFEKCERLSCITIPKTIKFIDTSAFAECEKLECVHITDLNAWCGIKFGSDSGFIDISCEANPLWYAEDLLLNEKSVTDLSDLKNIDTISGFAFCGYGKFKNITVPVSVKKIGNAAFYNCDNLIKIDMPDTLTDLGEYTFAYCSKLSDISLPKGISSINKGLYEFCNSLTEIEIPDNIFEIKYGAFSHCNNITKVYVSDSVVRIQESAFYSCDNLSEITLLENINYISDRAFSYCDNLTIKCYKDSYVDHYASENDIPVIYLCKGHKFSKYINDNNATCTKNATQRAYCDNGCGAVDVIDIENSALGHSFTNYIEDKAATCTESGIKTALCNNGCGISDTVIIEARGHNYIYTLAREASCTKVGKERYDCDICGDGYVVHIPVIPHSFTDYIYDNNATCTADGTKTAFCNYNCGTSDTVTATGTMTDHGGSWVTVLEAQCTVDGREMKACPECSYAEYRTIQMTGHEYEIVEHIAATCTDNGLIKECCKKCNDIKITVIPALNQENGCDYQLYSVTEATCTQEGVEKYECTLCTLSTEIIIPKKEHSFSVYTTYSEPSCTEKGKNVSYCDYGCGNYNFVTTEALGHKFELTEYVEPTCNKDGYSVSICKTCGYKIVKAIPCLNPGNSCVWTIISNTEATCTVTGACIYHCNVCGDSQTVISAALGHDAGDWSIVLEPTEESEGIRIKYCKRCNAELESETLPKKENSGFDDVDDDDWFDDAVDYNDNNGYMEGTGDNKFSPNAKLTREQFVVILARVEGADLTNYTESRFTDVKADKWYGPSIIWAAEKGYVLGIEDGSKFGVGMNITREQIATMFMRYAEKAGIDVSSRADLSVYIDYNRIGNWAKDACSWAVSVKLLNSTSTTIKSLEPKTSVTRAQAAQLFMNYDKNVLGK